MSRIAVCSKYFGYAVGGAEHSTLRMLEALEEEGHQIVVLRNGSPKHFGATERVINLPESWEVRNYMLPYDFLRFRFLEYILNRRALRRLGAQLADTDVLYSYGFEAPAILSGFAGRRIYVVRDEYGLGWMKNYAIGRVRMVYALYIALEALPRLLWKQDLRKVLAEAEAVANSRFMATALRREFNVKNVAVILPEIDHDALASKVIATRAERTDRGVVFVGDGRLKGADIALEVARAMPETPFFFFVRKPLGDVPSNVTLMPWSSPDVVYAHARVVMVPSRWHEAYGRVVAEALGLGIPTVISDRAGLLEAAYGTATVVPRLDDIAAWTRAIRAHLPNETEPDAPGF
jgi:glycosyltransferase involved in cell wall biosynthesis